ncbi:MAG: agmatine deiminase family protein [Proteobacteria bacterium]|jgi:agmatine/peptidylarginine deiminase|nr:agmatine deiminase family protein [Pseudomonadota bacterium]
MRSRLVSLVALACTLFGTSASAQGAPEEIPSSVRRPPRVLPTADEIANPWLYHPAYETEYAPPAASALPAPPPTGVLRPGEFEPMDSALITVINYGGAYFPMWRDMIDAYSGVAHVYIIMDNTTTQNYLQTLLDDVGVPADAYTYLDYPVNTIWVRDYGPETVREEDGTRHIVDFDYGSTRPLDNAIPGVVAADSWFNADGSPAPLSESAHQVSGGNIMTDGAGTCFFSNILYGYEKPTGWSDEDVTNEFRDYLGCEQMIILNPICLDATGHIDLYAKILGRHSILLGQYPTDTHFTGETESGESSGHCSDPHFPNDYQDQEDNLAILEATTNLEGEPWVITRLPMLEPYEDGGWWVYRSYMNSQIINGVVAMPSYYEPQNDETADYLLDKEAEAITAYEAAAPNGVEVWAIDSDHIIPLAGAIHCITHEMPAEEDYEYTEASSDTDTDTDADGGADDSGGSSDDGCGCMTVGTPTAASFLSLILG